MKSYRCSSSGIERCGHWARSRTTTNKTTKIGVVEALKDTGLIDKDNSGGLEAES